MVRQQLAFRDGGCVLATLVLGRWCSGGQNGRNRCCSCTQLVNGMEGLSLVEKNEVVEVNDGGVNDKLLSSETTGNEEHSLSSTEDSSSTPSVGWLPIQEISEIEMMKERFAKLLLGEDMSGCGNGGTNSLGYFKCHN